MLIAKWIHLAYYRDRNKYEVEEENWKLFCQHSDNYLLWVNHFREKLFSKWLYILILASAANSKPEIQITQHDDEEKCSWFLLILVAS
jgi:hypothetical protein